MELANQHKSFVFLFFFGGLKFMKAFLIKNFMKVTILQPFILLNFGASYMAVAR